MPKRKPFIDKKKSVAFRLVHRSQRDPLIAADDHELVLDPIDNVKNLKIDDGGKELTSAERKEQLLKFGVYFDDDYDYLQHLKDANEVYCLENLEERYRINPDGTKIDAGKDIIAPQEKTKLKLPSSLFESKGIMLKTGLLNQAAPMPGPHPELDPDIVAALDDDNYDHEDPENILDDDFILKANAPTGSSPKTDEKPDETSPSYRRDRKANSSCSSDSSENADSDDQYEDNDDEDGDFVGKIDNRFDREETRTRFTNYSVTSSVMRRSSGLKTVDDVFEKLYEQYDDDQLGELENEEGEIAGAIPPESHRVLSMVEEYERDVAKEKNATKALLDEKDDETLKNVASDDDEYAEKIDKCFVDEKPRERWDCESILSTYSTLYNHPVLIVEPPKKRSRRHQQMDVDPKNGLPSGVLRPTSLRGVLNLLGATETGDVEMGSVRSRASTIRSKFETPEERRTRKGAVKLERKERRQEKKLNKAAFKAEEIRTAKEQQNSKHATVNRLV